MALVRCERANVALDPVGDGPCVTRLARRRERRKMWRARIGFRDNVHPCAKCAKCAKCATQLASAELSLFCGLSKTIVGPSPPMLVLTPPLGFMKLTLITKSLKLNLQTTPVKPVRKQQRRQAGEGATPRHGKVLAGIGKLFWWLMCTMGAALIKVAVEGWWRLPGS